jgi:hypothetical protein
MKKKFFSSQADSQGASPDDLTESTFPRLPLNNSQGPSPNPFSCETSQHFYTDPSQSTRVPILAYRKYQDYHSMRRKQSIPLRQVSETPRFHFLYHPEFLRVSPRAKVEVFTRNPKEQDLTFAKQQKNLQVKLKRIGKKSKILPNLAVKTEEISVEFSPAWTMGEKLYKLAELSPLMKF